MSLYIAVPVKTCTTLFKRGLLRLKRRIVSREDFQPTDSFILKQSFRSFHIYFHLSVDQSLTVLTQLAYGTVIKGSGPCIFDLDPDLLHSLPLRYHAPRDGQDHQLLVILKIKFRSSKKCDLEDQDQITQTQLVLRDSRDSWGEGEL